MRNVTEHVGTLEIVKRLPSSRNGNPRYLVRLDGWTAATKPDSMEAYGNVPNNAGKRVRAYIGTYYGRATIEHIRPEPEPKADA